MSKNSKIFVTAEAVDYAFVSSNIILGNSEKPILSITGLVDEVEDVVVDFGTIKKALRDYKFFDHMLVVNDSVKVNELTKLSDEHYPTIDTLGYKLDLGRDGVYNAKDIELTTQLNSKVSLFNKHLRESEYIKTLEDRYKVAISLEGFTAPPTLLFLGIGKKEGILHRKTIRYTHLLPMSTSRGCQTIHGHKSNLCVRLPLFSEEGEEDSTKLPLENAFLLNETRSIMLLGDKYSAKTPTPEGVRYIIKPKDRLEARVLVKNEGTPLNPFISLKNPPTQETIYDYMTRDLSMDVAYLTEGISKGVMVD